MPWNAAMIPRHGVRPGLAGLFMLLTALVLPVQALAGKSSSEERAMVLMTGTPRGVYYPVGSALCTLFNFDHGAGSRCVALRSRGSVANIAALKAGNAQLALVQSDTQAAAFEGRGEFTAKGAFRDLRSLFALYSENMAVLVRADSDIRQIGDLKGKRINIGHPESGQHAVVEQVLGALGLSRRDFVIYLEKGPGQVKRLCTGELDAAVFLGGSPNGHVTAVTLACDIRLLPVDGPQIQRLLEHHPEFSRGLIPGGRYRGNPDDIPTVSVTATLVTTASQSEDEVYAFVRTIFDNFQILAELHPVLNELEPREMAGIHGAAPLHPGAQRFFRERGLIAPHDP
jgi:TRAP transporter TAXI family solute receptor